MISKAKSILSTGTFKDSTVLFIGNILATVSGFLITIVLTRTLTPADFGLFVTAMAFAQLLTDSFDLGLNPALISFIPGASLLEKKQIIKTSFILRFVISLVLGLFLFIFSKQVAEVIFKNNNIESLIQISVIGVILFSLVTWGQSVFQAERRFIIATLIASSVNVLRFGSLVLLVILGFSNLNYLYLVFQLVIIISVIIVLLKLDVNLIKEKFSLIFSRKILKFGLPVGFSFAIAATYTRLDQIFIFNYLGEIEAGIYGLAFRVSSASLLLAYAFNSVIAPRFSSMDHQSFKRYFIKTILASVGLSVLSLIVIIFSPLFIPLLFGKQFLSSINPFKILMIGAIFFTLSAPFYSAILYRFKNSHFSLISSILSLGSIFILLNLLIPVWKTTGAAWAVTFIYFIQLCIAASYFFYLLKKQRL